MNGELITVIVPTYNIEGCIQNTVNSIRNQTYSNLEIILVNDGSYDKTPEVLDELAHKDSRIRVIHKANGGVTSARIKGIESAVGDWIGFVDGDDYIEPDMYETLLSNAKKYGADISHCGYQMVFPSRVDYYYNTGRLAEQDNLTGLKDLLEGSFIEPGLWNKLFHKNLFHSLLQEGAMDTSIRINEDLLMNYYLFKASRKSVFYDICPYHYMLRENSAATSKINKHKLRDPLTVMKMIRNDADGDLKGIVDVRIATQLIALSTMSYGNEKDLIKPYRQAARKELREKCVSFLKSGSFCKSMKIRTLWASIFPASYGLVHKLYSRITGIDRKYEIS